MARQPFRQGKSDGSMEEAGGVVGGDGNRFPAFKTLLSNNDDKVHTLSGIYQITSYSTTQNKYGIFHPFYSGPGGTFTKLSVHCNSGVSSAAAGITFWSEDSNNRPKNKVAGEFEIDFTTSGIITLTGQSIVLEADTRYWVSYRQHPDASGVPNFSCHRVIQESIAGGDQNIAHCNVLFYLSTSAFGSTTNLNSFTSTYRTDLPKVWLEIS